MVVVVVHGCWLLEAEVAAVGGLVAAGVGGGSV